ncbi:MAG: cytochrome c oxidase subunit [Chloroflexota bacterium]|nr:cytochrome c oxidase subunit [Chloroflexota bacterium]MEA2669521.1 cytochrome c oxidase subunit [Chloroflexota bacterium]
MAVRTQAYDSAADAEVALDTRLVAIGTWLFLAAEIFFFVAWWFAFFYLRALNNDQAWKAQGIGSPSRGYGAVVVVLALLTAGAYWLGSRAQSGGFLFRLFTPVALVLGIATCLFQGYEMWHLGFGMTDGGYPSVFSGLSGSWVVQFALATVWLGSIVTQAGPAGDTIARRKPAGSFAWILLFLAVIGVINYVLLYFVA